MSASFSVGSSTGSYEVAVAEGTFASTMERMGDGLTIADEFFRGRLECEAIFIEANEGEKSLDRMPALIERMRVMGVNRRTAMVAVGGGIIQDLSAFTASVYMRGLGWTYVPTTVLAMVDSCIGGKSSINVGPYKNLVGTFHPPQSIHIDPSLAETLPRDQFASGLIEAAKICFCRGAESFATHLGCGPSTTMSTGALEQVIVNSLLAKKHFIEMDEFDKKERLLLNFGHTFGHAIEGASHYGVPHGIAVGLGIVCSLAFQRARGLDFAFAATVGELEKHLNAMIRTLPGLREQMRGLHVDEVLERFGSDKKHGKDNYTLILVSAKGDVVMEQIARSADVDGKIRAAVETTIESYSE